MDRFRIIAKKYLHDLPKTSGVYCFKSIGTSDVTILYIGKAINIQSRVKNHFQQPSYRDNLFMDKIDRIGFFETGSEIEALILEASLIKKHQPKFNVVWKDDKNYFYVAIAQNENKIPYVFITHQPHSLDNRRSSIIQRMGKIKVEQKVDYIGPFVEGTALKKTLRFLRRVFPYYSTRHHPKITAAAGPRPGGAKCTYCHLGLCPGPEADLKEYKKNIKKLILILQGKRSAVLTSLKKEMKQFSKENKFEEAGKIRDRIYNLQQVMAHTNVINSSMELSGNLPFGKFPDNLFQNLLGLKNPINRIECYDVSNIQGKSATGSMVVFIDGKADKNQYRKFKINPPAGGENTPNDIGMLRQTLQRRFAHAEWKFPEIILIDGGIAQLNVAIGVKNENPKTKHIKVISIAKRNKDLYIEGRGGFIPLKTMPREIFNLVLQLDDEAHRFAITYHKKLRKDNLFK